MESSITTGQENDSPAGQSSRKSAREQRRAFQLMAVLWSIMFLGTLASTRVGALFMGDTLPAALLTMGALLLCPLLVLAGIGVSVVRRSWTPLLMSALNLVVSVVVFYATLAMNLNVPVIDLIRGKPTIVSIYVGTQNSATLTLRKNGSMDVFWSSWPGATRFWGGTYQLHGADLKLHFKAGQGPVSNSAVVGADEVRLSRMNESTEMRFHIVHAEPGATPR